MLISVLGHDQPGIIAALAAGLAAHQCNIENVSQTLLQDVFGALLIVRAPEQETPAALNAVLQQACQGLGLSIHVDPYEPSQPAQPKPEVQPYIVTAIGPDRQGLVADVAHLLHKHGVNIVNLQALFKGGSKPLDNLMIFHVEVPRQTVMHQLRADLAEVSRRLSLEINIQHRGIFEAVSAIDY
jgi:glycine cleavage system transcriptional repressor